MTLIDLNILPMFIMSIIEYYRKTKSIVLLNNNYSNFFETTTGVKQGEPISPWFWSAYTSKLIERTSKSPHGTRVGEIKL